jgi:NADPH:quinone reductase-like Zn-dependent oxidoreductase
MTGTPYLARILGFGLRAPKVPVPGWAVAGTVEAAGKNVTGLKAGDEVFGTCRGSFAQYVAVRAAQLAPKPASLTFEQAAAIPGSATTALQAVRDKAKLRPGQHVLIIGASGGVGTFAVQIAKALGAEVTGTASTAKTDLVMAIGADHVLDYTREDITSGQHRYDAIIDIGGNRPLAHLRRALTPKGTLVITGGEGGGRWLGGIERNLRAQLLSPFVSQKLIAFVARQPRADLMTLRDMAGSGAITPAIDRTYPLAQAATAVRHLAEGRVRGKVVITI